MKTISTSRTTKDETGEVVYANNTETDCQATEIATLMRRVLDLEGARDVVLQRLGRIEDALM